MTAVVMDEDPSQEDDQGDPEVVMVYFPNQSCQVIDTWNVMGKMQTLSWEGQPR